ncbi:MAG: chemotaxis protein CheA [Pseudomonadota bacterium]
MVDPAKYRALFVSESREILDSFQSELLRFERHEAGRESVDAMFRAAHSLKGMAASMGYEAFAELAHAMEDLTGDAREQGSLGTEAVDLLLAGVDQLGSGVTALEGGSEQAQVDAAALIQQIRILHGAARAAAATHAPSPSPVATAPVPDTKSGMAPGTARSGEGPAPTRVAIQYSDASTAPQVRAFMLQRELGQSFELLEITPSVEDLKAGRFPERRLTLAVRGTDAQVQDLMSRARSATDVAGVEVLAGITASRAEAPSSEVEISDAVRTVRVKTEILDEFIDSVGELLRARDRLRTVAKKADLPELNEIADELMTLTKDLYDRVMLARMTPLALLTDRLPRVVRDLARRKDFKVELRIEGADIEMDRALLDELHSAILHIVRNAVDHGHEGAAARRAAAKPEALTLVIRATRDRDQVLLEIEDDGKGMDADLIGHKALTMGIIDEAKLGSLSRSEVLELICAPGFSTASEVTEVSGRGVGMDAVRSTVERLGGDLQIDSIQGQGTDFVLRLPLTMAIINVMLVECGNLSHAVPTSRVVHAFDLRPGLVTRSCGEALLHVDGDMLHFFDLGQLLGYHGDVTADEGTVLIFEDGSERSAVCVDRIAGMQEVVVKPLGLPLARLDYLAGAALLADGTPVYILDVGRLIRHGPGVA